MCSLDFLGSKCRMGPAVVANTTKRLSNYAGKAFVFSEKSSYGPQFSKGGLSGGVCLGMKTKQDNSKASLTNISCEHILHVWLVQFEVSLISVHWSQEVIEER